MGKPDGNARRNNGLGSADVRTGKAGTGNTKLADTVQRMTIVCQIMADNGHLCGDQRHRGKRGGQGAGSTVFSENFHVGARSI